MDPLSIPPNLLNAAEREGRQAWLATLPGIVKELQERWSLELADPFQPGGQTAWVAPARSDTAVELVLKVS